MNTAPDTPSLAIITGASQDVAAGSPPATAGRVRSCFGRSTQRPPFAPGREPRPTEGATRFAREARTHHGTN
jgi:hypothetical protein